MEIIYKLMFIHSLDSCKHMQPANFSKQKEDLSLLHEVIHWVVINMDFIGLEIIMLIMNF